MKTVVWRSVEDQGIEHLIFQQDEACVQVESVVIRASQQAIMRLDYALVCDSDYTVREATLAVAAGNSLRLTSDGQGRWFKKYTPLPELDGCIDVDLAATPFTNTLPIRRIHWQVGQVETFKMVYISVPDLIIGVDPQRYTCLEKSESGAVFLYESLDSDFRARITVDADGLILDYPGLFERIV